MLVLVVRKLVPTKEIDALVSSAKAIGADLSKLIFGKKKK